MTITANGRDFEIDGGTTLPTFLESIGYSLGLVIVERNKRALSPSESKEVILQDKDTLEIVKIVAGG